MKTYTGEILLQKRKEWNLSQESLGKLIGVAQTVIGRWERGESPIGNAYQRILENQFRTITVKDVAYSNVPKLVGKVQMESKNFVKAFWDESCLFDQDLTFESDINTCLWIVAYVSGLGYEVKV